MLPNAICENKVPKTSIFRHIGNDSRSDFPNKRHNPPINKTENNARNRATVNGVVPPLKVIGPKATASPRPIEHRIAQVIPVSLFDFTELDIVTFAKNESFSAIFFSLGEPLNRKDMIEIPTTYILCCR